MKKCPQPIRRARPIAERLEGRVLYSADPVGAEPLGAEQQVQVVVQSQFNEQSNSAAVELVVIDSRVDDYQALIADLSKQQLSGRQLELLIITADQDAIGAISQALQSNHSYSAIHIVSHGSDGRLELGAAGLDNTVINREAARIADWSLHLTDSADIRLYGCEFAHSATGLQAMHSLASLTGADIAASSDNTGNQTLKGNWALEASTGQQDSSNLLSRAAIEQWHYLLGAAIGPEVTLTNLDVTNLAAGQTNTTNRLAMQADGSSLIAKIEIEANSGAPVLHLEFSGPGSNPSKVHQYPVAAPNYGSNLLNAQAVPIQVAVNTLDNGDYSVAWVSTSPNNHEFTIGYAVYDKNGTFISKEFLAVNALSISHLSISGQDAQHFAVNYLATTVTNTTGKPDQVNLLVQDGSNLALNYTFENASYEFLAVHANHIQNGIYVVAITAHSGTTYSLLGATVDTTQLNPAVIGPRIVALPSGSNVTQGFIIHQHSLDTQPIYNPQVVAMEGKDFAVVWTEKFNYGSDPSFVNVAANTYKLSGNSAQAVISSGPQISVGNLSQIDSARVAWDSTDKKIVLAYTTDAGIEMLRFNTSLVADAVPTQITAPPGKSLMVVGVDILAGKGNVLYQVMPLANATAPPASNSLANANFDFNLGGITIQLPPRGYTNSVMPVTITLSEQPTSDVTFEYSPGRFLTIVAADWNIPKKVYISIGATTGNLTLPIRFSSSDAKFNYIKAESVQVVATPSILVVDTDQDIEGALTFSIADLLYDQDEGNPVSLRRAINVANLSVNDSNGPIEKITFANSYRIILGRPLAVIETTLRIEGAAVNGGAWVVIDGGNTADVGLNFSSTAKNSVVDKLIMGNFTQHAIFSHADNLTITNSRFGYLLSGNGYEEMRIGTSAIYLQGTTGANLDGNYIGNSHIGITLDNTVNSLIQNNQIGKIVEVGGYQTGNTADGISLINSSASNDIKGNTIAKSGFNNLGNRIGTAASGVRIQGQGSDYNRVFGNQIIGNAFDGITIEHQARFNTIGGTTNDAGSVNSITLNGFNGVHIWTDVSEIGNGKNPTTDNRVLINTIFDNGQQSPLNEHRAVELSVVDSSLPLDQQGWGSTPQQDAGDADVGSNGLINSLDPLDSSPTTIQWRAYQTAVGVRVAGKYVGSANTTVRIDLYSYDVGKVSPEMQTWLGTLEVTTNTSGIALFDSVLNGAQAQPSSKKLTGLVTEIVSGSGQTALFGSSSRTSLGINVEATPSLTFSSQTTLDEDQAIALGPILAVQNTYAPNEILTLTISSTSTTFSVGSNNNITAYQLQGSAAAINALLQSLLLALPANFNGPLNLDISLSNINGPVVASGVMQFSITPVNDAPSITANSQTITQNTGLTLRNDMFVVTDDVTPLSIQSYRLSTAPQLGQLLRNGVALNTNDVITFAQMQSGQITYVNLILNTTLKDQFSLFVTDGEGLESTQAGYMLINLTPSQTNGPVFVNGPASVTVPENEPWSQIFQATTSTTNGTVGMTLAGLDRALFTLQPTNVAPGQYVLALINAADFETRSNYDLQLIAFDNFSRQTILNFRLNIQDLDEAPYMTIAYPIVSGTIFEDQTFVIDGQNGTATLSLFEPDTTAPNNQIAIYIDLAGGTISPPTAGLGTTANFSVLASNAFGNTSVLISGGKEVLEAFLHTMKITGEPNSTADIRIDFTVQSAAITTRKGTPLSLYVLLTAQNDAPVLSSFAINAIQAVPTVVTIDRALISDVEQYSLTDNNFSFALASLPLVGQLQRNGVALSVNEQFTYSEVIAGKITYLQNALQADRTDFTLRVFDAQGLASLTATIPVNLLPTNAPPNKLVMSTSEFVPENTTASWIFSYVIDSGVSTYDLFISGNDAERFSLTDLGGGKMRLDFIRAADFDLPAAFDGSNSYSVQINLTDNLGRAVIGQFRANVLDVNENASLSGTSGVASLEDTAILIGSSGRTLVLSDPDKIESVQQLTLNLTNGWFNPIVSDGLTIVEQARNAQGITQISLSGNASRLQSVLSSLVIQPNKDFNGLVSMSLNLQDLSASSNRASLKLDFVVSAVNDVPTLTIAASSLLENATLQLNATQFSVSDIDSAISQTSFEILGTPSLGKLMLNGQVLVVGQRFTQAQLDAGLVSYQHASAGAGNETISIAAVDADGAKSVPTDFLIQVNRVVAPVVTTAPAKVTANAPASGTAGNNLGPDSLATEAPASVANGSGAPGQISAPAKQSGGADKAAAASGGQASASVARTNNNIENQSRSGETLHSAVLNVATSAKSNVPAAALAQTTTANQSSIASRGGLLFTPELQAQLAKLQESVKSSGFTQDMTQMRDQVNQGIKLEKTVVTSTVAVSTTVSIGYVIWLLRGGVLLSSLMASLPAWRAFDPLPILASKGNHDTEGEDDSLENLLEKARKKLGLSREPKPVESTQTATEPA
jgi:hypothetical protein